MLQGFIELFYPYTGDPRMITFLEDFFDYELEHSTTPADEGLRSHCPKSNT